MLATKKSRIAVVGREENVAGMDTVGRMSTAL